jgi:hypothetical protein
MNQTALVARLLDATESIEHAVQMADWPSAVRFMQEREPLFAALAAEQEPAGLEKIRRIQSINATIIKQAQAASDELQSEYRAAMRSIEGAKQYKRVSSF